MKCLSRMKNKSSSRESKVPYRHGRWPFCPIRLPPICPLSRTSVMTNVGSCVKFVGQDGKIKKHERVETIRVGQAGWCWSRWRKSVLSDKFHLPVLCASRDYSHYNGRVLPSYYYRDTHNITYYCDDDDNNNDYRYSVLVVIYFYGVRHTWPAGTDLVYHNYNIRVRSDGCSSRRGTTKPLLRRIVLVFYESLAPRAFVRSTF